MSNPAPTPGFYTPPQAAAYLKISVKTLDRYVDDGTITYILMGRGKIRKRIAFAQADLDAFEEGRRRCNPPPETRKCQSTNRKGAKNTSTIFGSKVIAFTDLLAARGEKL